MKIETEVTHLIKVFRQINKKHDVYVVNQILNNKILMELTLTNSGLILIKREPIPFITENPKPLRLKNWRFLRKHTKIERMRKEIRQICREIYDPYKLP